MPQLNMPSVLKLKMFYINWNDSYIYIYMYIYIYTHTHTHTYKYILMLKITVKIYKSSGLYCEDLPYYSLLGYDTVLLARWVPTRRVCGAVNKDCTKLHLFNYYC